MDSPVLLEITDISKTFPGVKANDRISLSLRSGEVKALLGENGAGKSTLIKIIMGILKPDGGSVLLEGRELKLSGAYDAQQNGIRAVFQELSQISSLSVAENIYLMDEPVSAGIVLNRETMYGRAQELLDRYEIDIRARTLIGYLPIAKRQLIEIVKAIAHTPKVLILDEPTSTLTDTEAEILYGMVNELQTSGTGVIFITHRLNEVFRVANTVAVLRDGKNVADLDIEGLTTETIVGHMVGRALDLYTHKESSCVDYSDERVLLETEGIALDPGEPGVSFKLRKGEILGLAGLVGSGRSELMQLVFGIDTPGKGTIRINGSPVCIRNVPDAMRLGLAMVPENRHLQGLNLMHSVEDNIALPLLQRFTKLGILIRSGLRLWVHNWISALSIKTDSGRKLVNYLSGGNQQKVVIAKWLSTDPAVLIVDEPTAGIDVGSKKEIHTKIQSLAEGGMGIILISSDMPELLALSDRILVMNKGAVIGEVPGTASQEEIMSLIMQDNMKHKESVR